MHASFTLYKYMNINLSKENSGLFQSIFFKLHLRLKRSWHVFFIQNNNKGRNLHGATKTNPVTVRFSFSKPFLECFCRDLFMRHGCNVSLSCQIVLFSQEWYVFSQHFNLVECFLLNIVNTVSF